MIIRDAIHLDAYVDDKEKEILDTKEMQRLRGIKQLGTAYLVYPTALHTRFDHSIGVNATLKRLMLELANKPHTNKYLKEWMDLLKAASLVHDVTHIPFGHTFEDEMLIFDRHDKKNRYEEILTSGEIGSVLEKRGFLDDVIELLSTDPEKLEEPWIAQILTNTICADNLDYLRRDAYFCGLKKDYDDRIFKYFDLQEKDGKIVMVLDLAKGGMLRRDALTEVIHILRLRYFLAERVYFHHTKVCSGAMLAKALNIARDYGLDKKDLYSCTDDDLFNLLLQYPSKRPDKSISKLIMGIKERKLLKRAYILSPESLHPSEQDKFIAHYHELNNEREKREEEIAQEVGAEPEDIVIYCMGREALKEADVYVSIPDEIKKLKEIPNIEELEAIIRSYMDLWRFYVFAPADKVREVHNTCERIFEKKCDYVPKYYRKGLELWTE